MQKYEWYSDTDPSALKVFLERQRVLAPSEKIQAVFRQNRLLQGLAEARERELHPEADDREIFLRVVAWRLDRETMRRVYGWHPDDAN